MIFCATQHWFFPIFQLLTQLKWEQKEIDQKTAVVYYVSDLDNSARSHYTLGVAVRPRRCIADQLLAKADVVQLCQDPQTEFAFIRESLGVSGVNHIFRAHGYTVLTEKTAPKAFDEAWMGWLESFFPAFTEVSAQQATLNAGQAGIGCKRSVDVARPAHLSAAIAARPRIKDMIRDTTTMLVAVQPPSWAPSTTVRGTQRAFTCKRKP